MMMGNLGILPPEDVERTLTALGCQLTIVEGRCRRNGLECRSSHLTVTAI